MFLKKFFKITLFLFLLTYPILATSNFAGSYKMDTGKVQLYLVIVQKGNKLNGGLTGTTGANFKLQGTINGDRAFGQCYGENVKVFFNLYFADGKLYLQLIEPDANGKPDWGKVKELVFTKTNGSTNGGYDEDQSSSNNFSGFYRGSTLYIQMKQIGRNISGILGFKKTQYKIRGQIVNNIIKGIFETGSGNYNFTAKLTGNTLIFVTGGTTYKLIRQNSQNSYSSGGGNPLSGNSPNQTPNYSSENHSNFSSGNSKRITIDEVGISFTTPNGWIAKKDPNTGNYLMGSNQIPGFILISQHTYNSLSQLEQNAAEGFVDKNIRMYLSGNIERITNNAIGGEFSGIFQNVQAKAYVVGIVSPNGGGIIAMCITTADKYSSLHKRSVIGIAKSARFSTSRTSSSSSTLMRWLAGEYYSYQGSTERKLLLCPNGNYSYSNESSYGGNFSNSYGKTGSWGSANSGGDSGRWRIIGNKQSGTLIFTSGDGSSAQYSYQVVQPGVILIDNVKFAYKGPANCY